MSTILLLHAFGSSRRAWEPQIRTLGEDHRVLAPDLPGHGDAPGPFTLAGALDSVQELTAAESEPVHVVAISGAVTVALAAALRDPDAFACLVLSGGATHAGVTDLAQRLTLRALPEGLVVKLMKSLYAGGRPEHEAGAVDDLRRAGKATVLSGLREIARHDVRPTLGRVTVPTLVLCGEKDGVNVPHAKRLAAGIPDAELQIVPDVRHIWNLEQPELFTRTVADFIDRVEAAA